jgi:hypothetical protein
MLMERTGGLEPPFSAPFTDHRFEAGVGYVRLKRDDFSSNRHRALSSSWSMIFSENRYPLFGIMLYLAGAAGHDPASRP